LGAEGLDFQLVSVDFTGGLDTRTNPKLRVPGQWDLLTNCVHSKDGAISKREGVRALVAAANGNGLATFDDELLAINGTSVYSTNIQPSVGAVYTAGQLPCIHLEKREVSRPTNTLDQVDCAYGNGLEVYVWRERSIVGAAVLGVYFCVIDSTTRTLVIRPTLLSATGQSPRVVFLSDAFMFLWTQGAGPNLYAAVYSTVSGSVGPSTNLGVVVGILGAIGFDAIAFGFDGVTNFVNTAAVSYVFTDGVTSVRCSQVTYNEITLVPVIMATANLITQIQAPHATICGICLSRVGGVLPGDSYAATFIASPLLGAALNGVAGAAVTEAWAPTTATLIDGVTAIFGATQPTHIVATRHVPRSGYVCQVYVDGFADIGGVGGIGVRPLRTYSVEVVAPGLGSMLVLSSATLVNSVTNTNFAALQGPFIAGFPMVITPPVGGLFSYPETIALPVYMAAAGSGGVIQSGIYFLDGTTGNVLGKAMYGQHAAFGYGALPPSTPRRTSTPLVERTGIDTFVLPFLELGRFTLLDGSNYTTSGVATLLVTPNLPVGTNPADAWAPRRTQIGRSTMIANGMLALYDGADISEGDFNLFPEGLGVTTAAGGGVWAAGTYEFVAIYEWVDGQGQRHQSAPSPTVQVVVALNDTVTFRVPTLQLTQRANVKHVLYGTQPNGTTFTRFGTILAPIEIVNNKALAQSVTAVVVSPPAANELLYSQPFVAGTTLPNDAPGPCSIVGVHQQRLWINQMDRPGGFRYSQQLVTGVGLQFNELLGGQLPVEAGDVTGFASMDEMMIIVSERKLFRLTGTGPSPSGGYNGYSDPVEIPSDVGCPTPSSVLRIPDGVMFRSAKGWYLLTRDLSVKYIGAPVKRWDSDIITSAVLMEDRQEIRISSRRTYDTNYSGAIQFCYSYQSGVWSVFTVTSLTKVPTANTLQVWDAVWWPTLGRYVSISYYDGINQDTPGTYLDIPGTNVGGFAIGMSARSSFLHLAALEGFQRVRWLYLTASGPTAPATNVSFRIDFDDLYQTQNPPGAPGCYLTSPLTLTAIPFANPAAVDLRHKLRRQKCKSVAITVNENPVSAGAAGLTGFQALALQIGGRRGTNKLPAAQAVP